jgi:ABC-type multidrug transport system ATPase subunit
MRTIATLQEPDRGSIRLGDLDVLADKDAVRRVLGYLPQDFGVYPKVSALRMLDHFAVLKGLTHGGERRDTVESLLRMVNLWGQRKQKLGTFSGGMRQRFGIAQALIGDPQLLIVDEPTAGLDPAERRRFQNLLTDIGEDVVVILSTHIVDDVAELCPRMAIMAAGRILQTGEPAALLAALEGRVWRTSVEKSAVPALSAAHTVLATRIAAGRIEVRVLADELPPGMESAAPRLEDVYFATLLQHGIPIDPD